MSERAAAAGLATPAGARSGPADYEPPLTDWILRPFAASPEHPFRVSLAIALVFTSLSLGTRVLLDVMRLTWLWLDLLNGVLFAYIPTAMWLLRRWRLRDLETLRPALRERASFAQRVDAALCVPAGSLAAWGLGGAAVLGALPTIDPGFWDGTMPPLTHPFMLFMIVRMAATGWVGGHAIATEQRAFRTFNRIGAEDVRVDLEDLRPFEVFARGALRSAFAWVLLSSLISLFWLGPAAGKGNAFIVIVILAGVTAGVFASVYGPHRAIAAAKREALARVQARIARAGAALMAGARPDPGEPRLADLVAWQGFLEKIRDWPLDAPALARGALIAALGLGSWLGGALMDRIVDRFFG